MTAGATRHLDPGWRGMEGIFGGYVLAVAVGAVDTPAFPDYRPQSVTLAFVSTIMPGEVHLETDVVHRGRSTASVRFALRQGDRVRAHGIGSLVRRGDEPVWEPEPAPVRPPPEEAAAYDPSFGDLPYLHQLDLRGVGRDSLSDGATAWVRTRGTAADDLSPHALLGLFLDVLPPGVFAAEPLPRFVPSLELTAHFSARAASAAAPDTWFSLRNRTTWASSGYCVDECDLRDRSGRLLAQLRQGRQVRR